MTRSITLIIMTFLAFVQGPLYGEKNLRPKDIHKLAKECKAVILDVRELSELSGGHVEGAQWIATSEISSNSAKYQSLLKTLPKDKPIYAYCASGYRSEGLRVMLSKQGYTVYNIGGFRSLMRAGIPVDDSIYKNNKK